MRELVISDQAEVDLAKIWRYSLENWGEAQADRYLDVLDEGIRRCGVEPEQGRSWNDESSGYRSRLVKRHLVFYKYDERRELIQRVLHGSMDPDRHL